MASVGNIFGAIRMNTAGLKQDLASANRNITDFTGKSSSSFQKATKAVRGMRTALIGISAIALTAGITKSVKEFIKFEDALLDLQKVLTETEGSAKQFIPTVEKLSSAFAVAATDVLQSGAEFKQAGFSVQEAFELVEQSLVAVKISTLSAAEASDLMIATLTGFKAPASTAGKLMDILNEVSNNYATSLGELSKGMATISPIAKLMGFSLEETAGLLTPIIEVFRSGTEAGNALKVGLLRLIDDNKQVADALHSIGVSQRDLNGHLRSGKEILLDVQKAFVGLDKNQKVFVASQLAGARQAGRLLEVFNGLEKTIEVTSVAMDSQGSAQKELDIRMKSLGAKIDRVKEAFRLISIQIGEGFAEAVGEASEDITEFLTALRDDGLLAKFAADLVQIGIGFAKLPVAMKQTLDLLDAPANKTADFIEEQFQQAKAVRSGANKPSKGLALPSAGFPLGAGNTRFDKEGTKGGTAGVKKDVLPSSETALLNQRFKAVIDTLPQFKTLNNELDISASQFKKMKEESEESALSFQKMTTEGERIRESVRTSVEVMNEEQTRLQELFAAGVISQKTFDRAVIDSEIKFTIASEKMKKTSTTNFDTMKNAMTGWASSFSATLTDVLFGAQVTFGSILESFAKMIAQMMIQLLIIKPLMDAVLNFGFSTSSGGTTTHRQLGKDTVTEGSGGSIFGLADGGIVKSKPGGSLFNIGEGGKDEAVIPLDRLGQMGGGGNVTVNIIGAPEGTKVEEEESSGGGKSVNVIIDEQVAQNIAKTGSKTNRALSNSFAGMQPKLTGR
jgi:TP901 family phage tail tape measure protein